METSILFRVNLNGLGYFAEENNLFGNFPAHSAVDPAVFVSALVRSCRKNISALESQRVGLCSPGGQTCLCPGLLAGCTCSEESLKQFVIVCTGTKTVKLEIIREVRSSLVWCTSLEVKFNQKK